MLQIDDRLRFRYDLHRAIGKGADVATAINKWFRKLTTNQRIAVAAIVVPAIITIATVFSPVLDKTNHQIENGDRITNNNMGNIAGGDIHIGIDGDKALEWLVDISKQAGQSENEVTHLRDTVRKLEQELEQSRSLMDTGGRQRPQPSPEAKELAELISDDDSPYARALKAIAEGDNAHADTLLDQTQASYDAVHAKMIQAQVKIYKARIENDLYAGRTRNALQWCARLEPLVGDDTDIIDLLDRVYYENASYQKAEPLMERALEIDEARFGKDHPNVARDLSNLGALYHDTNRLDLAEPLMEQALVISEARFGKDHPDVARDLNNLAQLYKTTNRLDLAEPLMKRALAIDEASLGKDHPDVATVLSNLAQLYKATNRLDLAEPLMERALAIDEASFGKGHPDVARDLNNLAQLYKETNRLDLAEPLMERALAIKEASFGKHHPAVARDLNNLGRLYHDTNRLDLAGSLMERALAINETSLGKDHPDVAIDLNNLALLYQASNRLAEAKPLLERALGIFERSLGAKHPKTATIRWNLKGLRREMQGE